MPYCGRCHMALTGRAALDGVSILIGAVTALSRGTMPAAIPPPQDNEEDTDAHIAPVPPAPPAPPG